MYLFLFIVVKYTPQEIYSFISTSSGTKYFTELHDHCFCPRTASSQAYWVDRPQVQIFEDVLGESVSPGQKPEEPREAPAWPLGRLISSQASPTLFTFSKLPSHWGNSMPSTWRPASRRTFHPLQAGVRRGSGRVSEPTAASCSLKFGALTTSTHNTWDLSGDSNAHVSFRWVENIVAGLSSNLARSVCPPGSAHSTCWFVDSGNQVSTTQIGLE